MNKSRSAACSATVFEMAQFRKAPKPPTAAGRPKIYIEIDEKDAVHYGVEGVAQYDAMRLLRALLKLGECLVEVYHA